MDRDRQDRARGTFRGCSMLLKAATTLCSLGARLGTERR